MAMPYVVNVGAVIQADTPEAARRAFAERCRVPLRSVMVQRDVRLSRRRVKPKKPKRQAAVHLKHDWINPAALEPVRGAENSPNPLSARELEVVEGLSAGRTYKEIALDLGVTTSTVRTHLHNVYLRLGVSDRAQAVLVCAVRGWLRNDEGGR